MSRRWYQLIRDLHLYLGLFISPFVLAFAASVFVLLHAWLPQQDGRSQSASTFEGVSLPDDLEALSGLKRIESLKPLLRRLGVEGEVGGVRHNRRQRRLVIPVNVPGQETIVTLDLAKREAAISRRTTGLADGLVLLHMSPGQHMADIRGNWFYMRVWSWLADATVYVTLFLTVSGIYLWSVLRAERKTGVWLLAAGAITFAGLAWSLWY